MMFVWNEQDEFEYLVGKSRTMWLSQQELKFLIGIRDSNKQNSELAGIIVKDQHEKMCGARVWK